MINARILLIVVLVALALGGAVVWIQVTRDVRVQPQQIQAEHGDFATRFQPVPPPNDPPNTATHAPRPAAPNR